MPIDKSEIERYEQEQTVMQYNTLLGLLFDHPDTYFEEDEIIDYVDRIEDVLQIQLLIARITGATDDFPVEVKQIDGQRVYGLATKMASKQLNSDSENIDLPDELDIAKITAQLTEAIDGS